eukprot:4922815-Lingulodinium_polyedra.AAC.1
MGLLSNHRGSVCGYWWHGACLSWPARLARTGPQREPRCVPRAQASSPNGFRSTLRSASVPQCGMHAG